MPEYVIERTKTHTDLKTVWGMYVRVDDITKETTEKIANFIEEVCAE